VPEQELLFAVEDMANLEKPEWDLPDLATLPTKLEGDVIAIDLETRDDGIRDGLGSGWPWGGGHVVGYAIAADNWSGYLPVGHATGGNLDHEKVKRILNDWLSDEKKAVVGANILYDYGWADRDGVHIKGQLHDIQYAAAIINEKRWSYSLESLAKEYTGVGKDETLLKKAAAAWGVDAKGGLWRLPAQFVGQYAEMDATLARKLHGILKIQLEKENLFKLYEMERGLIRLYHSMRKKGVRISEERAVKLRDTWRGGVKEIIAEIKAKTGYQVDIWSADSLAKALRHENLPLIFTEKTHKPSITAEWLKHTKHWLTDAILKARQIDKLAETFIDSAILSHAHSGRIHTEFHPLRQDSEGADGAVRGTVSGRLSSTNPNLQQVPARTDLGNELRTIFLPEEGEKFLSADYSQQEPRILVHLASSRTLNGKPLAGAAEAVKQYQADPKMSYHKMVASLTGLPYKSAKILNLALVYGRGATNAAKDLGCSVEEAKRFVSQYHERLPFVKQLDQVLAQDLIKNRVDPSDPTKGGYITTLLGRKCRFTDYEPKDFNARGHLPPAPMWKAKRQWPGQQLQLAGLHKKLNRAIQGGASDQTKKAMLDIYQAGLGHHLLLQIHDELAASTPDPNVSKKLMECMRDAIALNVPVLVTMKIGDSWGELNEVEF